MVLGLSTVELTHVQVSIWVRTLIGRSPSRVIQLGDRVGNGELYLLSSIDSAGGFQATRAFAQGLLEPFEHAHYVATYLCGEASGGATPEDALM